MKLEQLKTEYQKISPQADHLRRTICDQIGPLLVSNGVTLGVPVESRVKSLESIADKVERLHLDVKKIEDIDDLVGIRLILLFQRDLIIVNKMLKDTFDLLSSEDTAERLSETQFGYQSMHHIVRLPKSWLKVPTMEDLGGLKAEIQVRTMAQHIWAAASHTLQYKQEGNVPPSVRRSIHRVSALLETADLEFERVLQERAAYVAVASKKELEHERLNVDLVASVLDEKLPAKNKKQNESYADFLGDLAHFKITTIKELRDLIDHHRDYIFKEEASVVKSNRVSREMLQHMDDERRERIELGVFYSHVGLARQALYDKFGKDFEKYRRAKLEDQTRI